MLYCKSSILLLFISAIGWSLVLSLTLDHPKDLKEFFSSTYIEKAKGMWDKKTNNYLFQCFKEGWALYHLHHVCVKGGQDGIVTGLEGVDNDWQKLQTENPMVVTSEDFNMKSTSAIGGAASEMDPIKSIQINLNSVNDIKAYITGGTLFANCFQQSSDSANPAHWMMKLGTFYEIAQCQISNKDLGMFRPDLKGEDVRQFRTPWKVMSSFYMHQCPNPVVSNWKWGDNMFNMIRNKLVESRLLFGGFKYMNTDGYPAAGSRQENLFDLTCFEDIYLSNRWRFLLIYI
jgi:hypothetical protein